MRVLIFILIFVLIAGLLSIPIILFEYQITKHISLELFIPTTLLIIIYPVIKISSNICKRLKDSNIWLTNTQISSGIIELTIPIIFSFLLIEYRDRLNSEFYGLVDDLTIFFICLIYFTILFLEWFRRYKTKKDKYFAYRYIFLVIIVVLFILSIKYLQLFYTDY